MKTLDVTPLRDNTVTLHQTKRGQLKRFIDDVMNSRWHVYEFPISEEDARPLFREMKRAYKAKKQPGQIGTRGGWFIYIQDGLQPILKKNAQGQYILQLTTYRWAR